MHLNKAEKNKQYKSITLCLVSAFLFLSPEMPKADRIIPNISNQSDTLLSVQKHVHLLNDTQLWPIQHIMNGFSIFKIKMRAYITDHSQK